MRYSLVLRENLRLLPFVCCFCVIVLSIGDEVGLISGALCGMIVAVDEAIALEVVGDIFS
jgi:hypothetical protein